MNDILQNDAHRHRLKVLEKRRCREGTREDCGNGSWKECSVMMKESSHHGIHHNIQTSAKKQAKSSRPCMMAASCMMMLSGLGSMAKISSEERNGDYKNSINFYKFLVREETVSIFHHFNTFCGRVVVVGKSQQKGAN